MGAPQFFLPAYSKCLTVPQFLCLSGFHPVSNKKVFLIAKGVKPLDMGMLIGNAMCVPVVGHVMAVALSVISPCPCC